jgi:hypothetical protein
LVIDELNTTAWLLQIEVELALIVIEGTTTWLIVIVILLEPTLVVPEHALVEVNTQLIMSLLISDDELYDAESEPTLFPFSFHWYEILLPGLVTDALKVTIAPLHAVVEVAFMVMAGAVSALTVRLIAFEVTDAGIAQLAFDVITHETRSWLLNVTGPRIGLLVPALTPFTAH